MSDLPDLPPLSAALEDELRDLAPVAMRRPWRDVAVLTAAATVSVGGFLLALALRRDLDALPGAWVAGFAAAWLASFGLLAWLALVPRAGEVLPRWFAAAAAAAAAGGILVTAGLLFDRATPRSLVYPPTAAQHLRYIAFCLGLGTAAAVVPFVVGVRLLRGSVPVGAVGAGAGLGAACAAAGGLMLHLHCPIAHPLHVGLGHGGVIVLGATAGALVMLLVSAREPARTRTPPRSDSSAGTG